jgi:hypothetical protein
MAIEHYSPDDTRSPAWQAERVKAVVEALADAIEILEAVPNQVRIPMLDAAFGRDVHFGNSLSEVRGVFRKGAFGYDRSMEWATNIHLLTKIRAALDREQKELQEMADLTQLARQIAQTNDKDALHGFSVKLAEAHVVLIGAKQQEET